MAPKGKQTNSRGKKETNPKNLWNEEKFLTKEHEDHYHKIMGLRSVIPEVKFDLKEDEYPGIQEQIRMVGMGNSDQSWDKGWKEHGSGILLKSVANR